MKNKMKNLPPLPKPPLGRIIREGTVGDCPKCHSTTVKKFKWFGSILGCIHPECENYFEKYSTRHIR